MAQVYLDTYLIVLLALEQISGKNIVVKRKSLLRELHTCLKVLYTEKVIPHLHSCLDEILSTSLARFVQMGLIESNSYGNKKGSTTTFLQSSGEQKALLTETVDFLMSLRPFEPKLQGRLEEELQGALIRAQGPMMLAKI